MTKEAMRDRIRELHEALYAVCDLSSRYDQCSDFGDGTPRRCSYCNEPATDDNQHNCTNERCDMFRARALSERNPFEGLNEE
ncbi:MAG: hypothetical protein H7Y38_14540 [Armatimonadetes bacterium]|nr:hypothetical protein [Armatimonadota bacterium]